MTRVECKNCSFSFFSKYDHELISKAVEHGLSKGKHSIAFIEEASSNKETMHRAICKTCLRFFDRPSRNKALATLKSHQYARNMRISHSFKNSENEFHKGYIINELPEDYRSRKEVVEEDFEQELVEAGITREDLSEEKTIKEGSEEVAYWIRNSGRSNYNEIYIAVQLEYLRCPGEGCRWEYPRPKHIDIYHWRSDTYYKKGIFKEIYDHYLHHYDLLAKQHTAYQNAAYSILQQLLILESCHYRTFEKMSLEKMNVKAGIAVDELIRGLGIPMGLVGRLLRLYPAKIGDLAFIGLSKHNTPKWIENVCRGGE